jgi:hypothetical protein
MNFHIVSGNPDLSINIDSQNKGGAWIRPGVRFPRKEYNILNEGVMGWKTKIIPIFGIFPVFLLMVACSRKPTTTVSTTGINTQSLLATVHAASPQTTLSGIVIFSETAVNTHTLTRTSTPSVIPPSDTPITPTVQESETATRTKPMSGIIPRVFDTFEFDFGGKQAWVKVLYLEDANSYLEWGSVIIIENSEESITLWESPGYDFVHEVYWRETADSGYGQNKLLVEWGVGAHGFAGYPIMYKSGAFTQPVIIGESGKPQDGFFSDGGGNFPFPGGRVVSVMRAEKFW